MQIQQLIIDDNKCLVDFLLRLNTIEHKGSSTIIIGENGTGKSTVLNSILEIFMSFYSPTTAKNIKYNYKIDYIYKKKSISITKNGDLYSFEIDKDFTYFGSLESCKKSLSGMLMKYIPERIFYFYDGPQNPTLDVFKRINKNHSRECTNKLIEYWNALYLTNHEYKGVFPQRHFYYCDESLTSAFLISLMYGESTYVKQCIYDTCHISSIDCVSVEINTKNINKKLSNDIIEIGIEGVLDLINFIDEDMTELFQRNYLYQNNDSFFFEIHGIEALEKNSIDLYHFFDGVISMLNAKLEPFVWMGASRVSCNDLSEGQRQLIKILGMLGMCKDEDTLTLMDEPDAHMNPKWKYDLKDIIDRCLEESINTQAIIATHDALVINGVDKRFIRVFSHNTGISHNNNMYITRVIEPTENTEGMGIDGLLQSEYYGLRTSYDRKTNEDFIRRQELYSKLINQAISDHEKKELRDLTKKLGMLPISYNSIDFLYDDFIREYMKSQFYTKEYLSYEEILERRKKIQEIVSSLYGEINEIH